jgi:endonuclease/exonuclease/phosphatase family metal-dependent hydrolase
MRFTRSSAGRAVAAGAAAALLVTPLALTTTALADSQTGAATETQANAARPALRVMTRNLYLGTDIMRPINAIQGKQDAPVLELLTALANATDTARSIVDATDFGTRSKLLAAEIADQHPDLVGLQEVALWRHGPLQLTQAAVPNATEVDYDFLAMLRSELKALGVPYRPVSVNWLSDVEAPSFGGTLQAPTNPRDVRLTMRDVILKRVGSDVKILDHHERTYDAGIDITIANQKLDFTRGYQWVNAERGDQRFRFINTHLEAFSSDVAYAEAQQMLAGPGDYRGTTIVVCDCNSDPLNQSVKTAQGDSLPHSEPYWLVTGQNDFNDTWLQWRPARFGWTSGLTETVDDPDASNFDHRIDMVFARTGSGAPLKVVRGTVTGDEVADRDPATGLWPSDHAGVVMRLRGLGRS